ncbi:MAG: class I adenylate-forming enzyme family protein [Coriobacteriia bacterium]|nr:class I adenylate-forming enzyme family protein [Coriobacteriia bacterium]
MPITDYLRYNAVAYGDEVALVEINPDIQEPARVTWHDYELVQKTESQPFRREITWKVFDEKANRLANLLMSRGIGKGHKVAILMMNCLEWMPIYFGVLKSGAVAVPFNFRYTSKEIQYCVELSDADVLIFGREFIGRVEEIAPQISKDRILMYVGADCPSFAEDYREMAADCSSEDPHVPLSDDDDAAIYFSSGTTGFPKAILHNHMSILHAARCEQVHHSQTHDDVFLCIPPLYHTGAKIHLLGHLLVGSKSVLLRGVTPENVFKTVSEEQCTVVWLLVPWAQDILVALEEGRLKIEDYKLDQWRMMHIGAQPVPRSLVNNWLSYFPHHDYDTNYGLSEGMGPGSVHLGVGNVHKVGAIGIPGFGWEAKLIDGNGNILTEQESVGELCLKGPALMNCYYNNPEATAESMVDGWLLTGDIARRDADGFYWLVDRKKDVVISGGENIYPVEIEAFMSDYAPIKDVAVIGTPDERLGEIATAIVDIKPEFKDSITEDDVNTFCLALPRYKRPRQIIFAEVLRNATGKIDKPGLRERYGAANLVERENNR